MVAARHTRVWDPLVRTIHWSVATLVVIEMLNEAGANPWHRYLGYLAAALVVVRLAWGCRNSGNASLASMAGSARRFMSYVKDPLTATAGHTPPGALMAFALWGLLLLVAVTGWMLGLDAYWGDEQLQRIHAWLAYALAACASVHVLAALGMSYAQRINLVKSMITGNKPA